MTMWFPALQERRGPLYQRLVDELADDIDQGKLAPGQQLPTHRALADHLGVTVGTVTRAYAEAARRGLVGGEIGRGTFVRRAGAGPYALPHLPIATDAELDLSVNMPATPLVDPTEAAFSSALLAIAHDRYRADLLAYQPHEGSRRHREAGVAWLHKFRLESAPDEVLVCHGGQHALGVVLGTLLQPGDTLLVEAVTFPGIKAIAKRLHLSLRGVAMDEHGLLPEALQAACHATKAKALFCMPTLQNPTASIMPERRRQQIVEVIRACNLTLVEDDAYGLLLKRPPRPLSALAPERSYFIAGTSKLLVAGLRIAFLRAPPAAVGQMAEAIWATAWMATPLAAEVIARWIRDGTADQIISARQEEATARQVLAVKSLAKGWGNLSTVAGYHRWLPLPPPWRSDAFVEEARRRGVLVNRSDTFAVGPITPPQAVRVCLGAAPSREALVEALGRLVQTVRATSTSVGSVM